MAEDANPDSSGEAMGKRPAVFLDRDGVINERRWLLVRRWEGFTFRPGVLDALKRLGESHFVVAVTTNQGAVGAGWIDEEELERIHTEMRAAVEEHGGRFDEIYACRHPKRAGCDCHKPRPGMMRQAAEELHVDLTRSWMVGDTKKDMEAGRAVGARTILVNPPIRARLRNAGELAEVVLPGLPEAVDYILGHSGKEPASEREAEG